MTDLNNIPPPPELPEDYECCNNGCDELCVFEIYKIEKENWERQYNSPNATKTDDKKI